MIDEVTKYEFNIEQLTESVSNASIIPIVWLTPKQLSKYIGLSQSTIYQYVSRGNIPFHRIPNSSKILFKRTEIDNWVQGEETDNEQGARNRADEIWDTIK